MSDIMIDLSGIIALLVFFWSAAMFLVIGIVNVLIANFRGPKKSGGVKKHPAFGFFAVAVVLMVLNLAAFGLLAYFIDANVDTFNDKLDAFALYVWGPIQIVIWIAAALIYNKTRK